MDDLKLHFVVSAPRSGSTWLATALNHHPEIFATEQRLFGNFCQVWQNNDGSTTPRITLDKYADSFATHYFHQFMNRDHKGFAEDFKLSFIRFMMHFAANRTGKSVLVDKVTPYPGTASFVVNEIRRLVPEAKIISLVRDGRDVLTSGAFDWLLKDAHETDRYRFYVDQEPGKTLTRFFDDDLIAKWAKNWSETIDAFADRPADCTITYESMKQSLSDALTMPLKQLGVANDESIRNVCEQATTFDAMAGRSAGDADPTAKARKGIAGDWRNFFTRRDGRLFHDLAGKQMALAGYEDDDQWVTELPEILNLRQ
jgi:hypothetical protein